MRKLIAVFALALLVACNSEGSTDPNSISIAGTYTMRTVNGVSLPASLGSVTIKSDVLIVNSGGTWSETTTARRSGASTDEVSTASGTYLRSGSTVTFYTTPPDVWFAGGFTESSLTMVDGTTTFVFTR